MWRVSRCCRERAQSLIADSRRKEGTADPIASDVDFSVAYHGCLRKLPSWPFSVSNCGIAYLTDIPSKFEAIAHLGSWLYRSFMCQQKVALAGDAVDLKWSCVRRMANED